MDIRRQLLIMRHASSPESLHLDDHERILDEQGISEARSIGRMLIDAGFVPEIVLCSDAVRAIQTWQTVSRKFLPDVHVIFSSALYRTNEAQYSEQVARLENRYYKIMLLGHNPTCERFVEYLCGQSTPFYSANAALLETTSPTWEEAFAMPKRFKLIQIFRPGQT